MARESFFNFRDIIRDRRKLTVFLVCVAVSLFSWVLISLSNEYNTTVVVPIRYSNFPENKTLINSVPDFLAVNVSGSGFDLLKYDDRLEKDTLVINLDNLKISVLGEYQRGYLDPSFLSKSLQNRLNGGLAINRVLSNSIEFLFDLKVSRVVRVKPMVSFTLSQGFVQLDSVSSDPQEVELYGPLSYLDTLKFVETSLVNLGEIGESKQFSIGINVSSLGSDASALPDSVTLSIPVDKLTEKRFMITPDQLNVPDSLKLLIFPNAIELLVQIPISRFNEIELRDFEVSVDYLELQPGYHVLPINIEKWPVAAEKVVSKPKQVEIVLSRKG